MSDVFNTNNDYAKKYDTWRRKEELQKLKDKYGDAGEDDSDSSSDLDSEDDEMLTNPKLQEDWLRTLTALKTKDPRIYQKDYYFFEDQGQSDSDAETKAKKKKKKEKPMYLKDYNRKLILEKGGIISSDEEETQLEEQRNVVTYHEEQEELRKSVVKAAGNLEDSESDDGLGGGLLLKRKRTIHEIETERKEQEEWSNKQKKKRKKQDTEVGIEAEPINTWDIPNLDARERFLKNFILGQAYTVKDKKRIPTYDEVVYGDEDNEEAFRQEEEFLNKAEKFEKRHNFRFEEYGGTEIKYYPREIKNLVRRKDTKRAEQRNAVKERKLQEKEKKKEEIKRLKNLKRQEILEKIEKLKAVTGNDTLAFNEDDLENDFDPDKHDEMMQSYFNDEYYSVGADEVQKPVFDMSDDEGNWDYWSGGAGPSGNHGNVGDDGPYVDDPDFCMDADYDPSVKRESRKKMKKKKNKMKLNEALEESKPVFDPNDKTFEEYLDEYYNLDYEDIIDDIPCRFKYRKVMANNFGLSTDEIINGNEKELNTWVSLKKISQYRTDEEEQYDINAFSVKAKNEKLKQRVLHSLYVRNDEKDTSASEAGKRKRKRGKKMDNFISTDSQIEGDEQRTGSDNAGEGNKLNSEDTGIDSSAQSDSANVKKKKKKEKRGKSTEKLEKDKTDHVSDNLENNDTGVSKTVTDLPDTNESTAENVPKKKREKKAKEDKKGKKKQMKLSNARLKAYGINPKKFREMGRDGFKYKYGEN